MSHFYFHVRQRSTLFEDKRGGEFPDLQAAWDWAVSAVQAIIRDQQLIGPIDQQWMEICDGKGATVASLPFGRVARALN
jgi:hypothetical protein